MGHMHGSYAWIIGVICIGVICIGVLLESNPVATGRMQSIRPKVGSNIRRSEGSNVESSLSSSMRPSVIRLPVGSSAESTLRPRMWSTAYRMWSTA